MIDTITRYVYEVYRVKSVSQAAQNLFISQPALSTAIRKVEQELGAPIFNRKTLPFTLTAEGRIYIEGVEKMMELEAQISDRIRDVQQFRGGTLRIATSAHLSYRLLPKILQLFHKTYPQVETSIQVLDTNIITTERGALFDALDKSLADIILLPLETVPEGYHARSLFPMKRVVAIPADTPVDPKLRPYALSWQALIDENYPQEQVVTELSLFREVEFVHVPPGSHITKKRVQLFGKYNISPYVTSNTSRVLMNYNLMRSGFGALMTTDANIATMPPNSDCMYFVLSGAAAKQDFCAVYPDRRDIGNLEIIQAFIQTACSLLETQRYMHLLAQG